jgi:hypothetical protein
MRSCVMRRVSHAVCLVSVRCVNVDTELIDMDMFGVMPCTDPLTLVVCVHCSKAVKSSRFFFHTGNSPSPSLPFFPSFFFLMCICSVVSDNQRSPRRRSKEKDTRKYHCISSLLSSLSSLSIFSIYSLFPHLLLSIIYE